MRSASPARASYTSSPWNITTQAIGEFEQLVEIFADQQHRRAAVSRRHDLGVDLRHRREIQPEAGIGGDQDLDVAAEFARQHRALDIAA